MYKLINCFLQFTSTGISNFVLSLIKDKRLQYEYLCSFIKHVIYNGCTCNYMYFHFREAKK